MIVALGGTSLFILKQSPFSDTINWMTSLILISSSVWIFTHEIVRCIKNVINLRIKNVEDEIQEIQANFNSTVKTLTFFYNSDKKEKVRLSNIFSEETEEIEDGEVEMRTVPNFLNDRNSSVIVMEGKRGSALRSHFHDRDVVFFVSSGKVELETSEERKLLNEGDSYKVGSGIRRKLKFMKESTVILTYNPPLREKVE